MKKLKVSANILLGLNIIALLLHFCIIIKLIPYNITWGGRLTNDNEMYIFESFSIIINLFFSLLLVFKAGYFRYFIPQKAVNILLWIFFGLFVLNTIGNVFAKTDFEKMFSILTLLNAILLWIILKNKSEIKVEV